jgi:hypothetical protein
MLDPVVEVAVTSRPDAELVSLRVRGVSPQARQQWSYIAAVDEHFCPAGADHPLLPRDRPGVAEVDDRDQAPVGVGAAVAGELQRDDLAGFDERLGEAFSRRAALIGMPVASDVLSGASI